MMRSKIRASRAGFTDYIPATLGRRQN